MKGFWLHDSREIKQLNNWFNCAIKIHSKGKSKAEFHNNDFGIFLFWNSRISNIICVSITKMAASTPKFIVLNTVYYVTVFGLSDTVTPRYTTESKNHLRISQFPSRIGLYPIHRRYGWYSTVIVYLSNINLFFAKKIFLKIHNHYTRFPLKCWAKKNWTKK